MLAPQDIGQRETVVTDTSQDSLSYRSVNTSILFEIKKENLRKVRTVRRRSFESDGDRAPLR